MSANSFKMRLMMAMKNAAKSRRKAVRKASRKRRSTNRKVSRKVSRKRRSVKRKASTYALFTKAAYAGKVKGLKLKSLKNLSKEPVVVGPIETQQQALQVLVSGLQVAQSRGVFKIEESAKLAEAIKLFQPVDDKKSAAE